MKTTIHALIAAACAAVFLSCAGPAPAHDPLVTAQWLAKHREDRGVVVLDVRTFSRYGQGHIPGAVQAFGPWQTMDERFRGFMMPPVGELAARLRSYGVRNDAFVVIYDQGVTAEDTARSARVLWTLETLGHGKAALLDGGFEAWRQAGLPVTKRPAVPEPGDFVPAVAADRRIGLDEVKARLRSGTAVFVDLRDMDAYIGHEKKAHVARYGHLRGAIPMPAAYLTLGGQAFSPSVFRPREELQAIARGIGLPEDRSAEIVVYSDHGLRAALGYFVLRDLLGYRRVRLYDGSVLEVASDTAVPMAVNGFGFYER
ncbi:sulfurtransferase [Dissulfurirhabdus thermomarina]|uniref:Sulfurtransferase n=1 Tax=Dissulfurirhabdus thermomarina TaxID=1765737 RepID=A0A6N9TLT3_DISTH|nr:rhodanese-like domain-containing protein [Dissulfurirhabdus thermomarina]NDY41390.1 sulfurtransferase [Dissulfurirhabdus thermomarina]NMX23594.1 sulfurtransferase [Dissulfurirhabdus thermomarina]